MSTSRIDKPNGLAVLKKLSLADKLGSAAAATGIILVAFGIVLQDNSGVGFGATIRTLGGALFLGGLGAVLFWEPQRRAAVIGAARRIVERYMAATVTWRWTDRMGLAGVAVGLVLACSRPGPADYLWDRCRRHSHSAGHRALLGRRSSSGIREVPPPERAFVFVAFTEQRARQRPRRSTMTASNWPS